MRNYLLTGEQHYNQLMRMPIRNLRSYPQSSSHLQTTMCTNRNKYMSPLFYAQFMHNLCTISLKE